MPVDHKNPLSSGEVQFFPADGKAAPWDEDNPFWRQPGKFPVVRVRFYWSEVIRIQEKFIPDTDIPLDLRTEESISGAGLYTPPILILPKGVKATVSLDVARDQLAYLFRAYPIRSLRIMSPSDGIEGLPPGVSAQDQLRQVDTLLREFYVRPTMRIGVYSAVKNPSVYKPTPGTRGVGPTPDDPIWSRRDFEPNVGG